MMRITATRAFYLVGGIVQVGGTVEVPDSFGQMLIDAGKAVKAAAPATPAAPADTGDKPAATPAAAPKKAAAETQHHTKGKKA